ncbi:hypothetical protein [Paenibacillus pini]|uniref:Metal-dependent phosphoesterase n=1 Tax=Paenibacillus pini JCM 16418 TaxID=1236976 RepID=W7YHM0_9BACL|nr:hypothetical protein [Paenibacillus pini]GAF07967.1 metal-dependent phosphoesterase [Paenibacillus pini JCM 16418]
MHALLERGYTSTIYGDLYKKLFARGEEGEEQGIAYVELEYVDAFDAILAIRAAGGVPVIAHPKQFDNFDAIAVWKEAGLMGIEVRHPLHDEATEERARDLAEQLGLLQTGGSDFHGFYSEANHSPLGSKSPGEAHLLTLQAAVERRNEWEME